MAKSRSQNMTNVVFRKDNIEQLNNSLHIMYETWLEVAEEKSQGQIFTIREVQTKLDTLVQKKWKTIQDVFLNDGYHDYRKGLFTKEEEGAHAKLVMDLVKQTDDRYNEIKEQIDKLYNNERSLKDEIHGLQNENLKLQEDLTQARWKLNQAQTECNNTSGQIHQLEQLNREKTEAITQLQRDATVELWEKEKQKILEKAQSSNSLSEEVTKQQEKEKFTLREKIKDLEMQLKKSKMSAELKLSMHDDMRELEEEKKLSFVLEKDLKKLDEELFNLQKQIVGLLEGLRGKFSASMKKFNQNSGVMVEMDPFTKEEFQRVEEILEYSRTAAANGELSEYVNKLGIYYQAKDSHVKKVIARKITTNFNINGRLRSSMPDRKFSMRSNEVHSSPGQFVTSLNGTNKLHPLEKKLSKADMKENAQQELSEHSKTKVTIVYPDGCEAFETKANVKYPNGNPQLLYSVTKEVNMLAVLRHFPFMLKEDIEDLWKQFVHYDRNKDGTLDISEVMVAISSSFGNTFTAPQIRDAMQEVDTDGDGDMDFFEFVQVANMLKDKSGRSVVYRNEAVQDKGRKMSKLCRIM